METKIYKERSERFKIKVITLSIFLLASVMSYSQSGYTTVSLNLEYNEYWVCDLHKHGEFYVLWFSDSGDYKVLAKLDIIREKDNIYYGKRNNIYIDSALLKKRIQYVILKYKNYIFIWGYRSNFFDNEDQILNFRIGKMYGYKKYIRKSYAKRQKKGDGWDLNVRCNGLEGGIKTVMDRDYRQVLNQKFKDRYKDEYSYMKRTAGKISINYSKIAYEYTSDRAYNKYRRFFKNQNLWFQQIESGSVRYGNF
jgi:hypothetical protein